MPHRSHLHMLFHISNYKYSKLNEFAIISCQIHTIPARKCNSPSGQRYREVTTFTSRRQCGQVLDQKRQFRPTRWMVSISALEMVRSALRVRRDSSSGLRHLLDRVPKSDSALTFFGRPWNCTRRRKRLPL